MRVLGISHDVLICSAALVEDGEVVAAVAEERLDRQKRSRGFPHRSIDWCLSSQGLDLADIDEIAIAWNPLIDAETLPSGWLGARRHRAEHLTQVPAQLMRLARSTASPLATLEHAFAGAPPITFVTHYDAHLGNSYFLTGWDEAAVAVLDGRAERQTSLLGAARGVKVERLAEVAFPHSLGLLYGAVTQFLGFTPDADEWKVMALAALGDPEHPFRERLRSLVTVADDGTFSIALEYFEFFNHFDPRMYGDRFVDAFGPPRAVGDDLSERDHHLAAACQAVFEDVTTEILTRLHERTGVGRLAVSGGCFMNSVFNGKVTERTPFDDVFVSSCPDDSGTSVGAALFLEAQRTGRKRATTVTRNDWGPGYSDHECLAVAERSRLPGVSVVDDPAIAAAADLVDGRIVGWFQGRMEFGQRALGQRSILLDPRRVDGKDVVNAAVKYREAFRPFAPAVLGERVSDWFRCEPDLRVPFMERVLAFRPERVATVPAVVHADGTGRVQTVAHEDLPRFHALIAEFERLTGVPIVLNTSFNRNGEPIVGSPDDAIRTFFTCGLDVLYLGNVRVAK